MHTYMLYKLTHTDLLLGVYRVDYWNIVGGRVCNGGKWGDSEGGKGGGVGEGGMGKWVGEKKGTSAHSERKSERQGTQRRRHQAARKRKVSIDLRMLGLWQKLLCKYLGLVGYLCTIWLCTLLHCHHILLHANCYQFKCLSACLSVCARGCVYALMLVLCARQQVCKPYSGIVNLSVLNQMAFEVRVHPTTIKVSRTQLINSSERSTYITALVRLLFPLSLSLSLSLLNPSLPLTVPPHHLTIQSQPLLTSSLFLSISWSLYSYFSSAQQTSFILWVPWGIDWTLFHFNPITLQLSFFQPSHFALFL